MCDREMTLDEWVTGKLGRHHAASRELASLRGQLAAANLRDCFPYRPGIPSPEMVAEHNRVWPMATYLVCSLWMMKEPVIDGFTLPRFVVLTARDGGTTDMLGASPAPETWAFRPCAPDGTPVSWPAVDGEGG